MNEMEVIKIRRDNYYRINSSYGGGNEEFLDLMKSEWNRYLTFVNEWDTFAISAEEMARVGFFLYHPLRLIVKCAFCRGEISDLKEGMDPHFVHAYNLPLCPFIMLDEVGNQPIDVTPINRDFYC